MRVKERVQADKDKVRTSSLSLTNLLGGVASYELETVMPDHMGRCFPCRCWW